MNISSILRFELAVAGALLISFVANFAPALGDNVTPGTSQVAESSSREVVQIKSLPAISMSSPSLNGAEPDPRPASVVSRAAKAVETLNKIHLSPQSIQIAEKLDLIPSLCDLDELSTAPETDLAAQIRRLKVKQKITDEMLVVILQVRDVSARIDRQVALLNRQRQSLEDGRDRASRLNSIANLLTNGVMQEIGQAGEMRVKETAGEEFELVAGGMTIALGALALKQESGKKQTVRGTPNLLAKVFDRPVNNDVDYPPIVWWYLNTAPPGVPASNTRRQDLLDRWHRFGVLPKVNPSAEKRRATSLSNSGQRQVVTIDLLADQASLLEEVKTEIYQLDHDLLQLMISVQAL